MSKNENKFKMRGRIINTNSQNNNKIKINEKDKICIINDGVSHIDELTIKTLKLFGITK